MLDFIKNFVRGHSNYPSIPMEKQEETYQMELHIKGRAVSGIYGMRKGAFYVFVITYLQTGGSFYNIKGFIKNKEQIFHDVTVGELQNFLNDTNWTNSFYGIKPLSTCKKRIK